MSGVNGLALTKLDVLDGFDEIKICTHYKLGDKIINHFPAGMTDQANVEPVYETVKGWKGSTRGARSLDAAAGRGGEVCAPSGRAGGQAGGAAVHVARSGRM